MSSEYARDVGRNREMDPNILVRISSSVVLFHYISITRSTSS